MLKLQIINKIKLKAHHNSAPLPWYLNDLKSKKSALEAEIQKYKDNDPEVLGSVHGDLKSLDLTSSTYIGAVPALLDLAAFNMGTSQGLVGCIRRLKWNHRIIRLLFLDSIRVLQYLNLTLLCISINIHSDVTN